MPPTTEAGRLLHLRPGGPILHHSVFVIPCSSLSCVAPRPTVRETG